MKQQYFCLRCETEIYFDETKYRYFCDCLSIIPNLAFVPEYWIGNTEGEGERAWKELDRDNT